MPRQKKFKVGDCERLVQVLFYMLLGLDNLQFSVDCPIATVTVLPTRRVSHNLALSREVRRPMQACPIINDSNVEFLDGLTHLDSAKCKLQE